MYRPWSFTQKSLIVVEREILPSLMVQSNIKMFLFTIGKRNIFIFDCTISDGNISRSTTISDFWVKLHGRYIILTSRNSFLETINDKTHTKNRHTERIY